MALERELAHLGTIKTELLHWLSIDPTFAPLRGNPSFERLVNAKK
jgi:hypothetical protein